MKKLELYINELKDNQDWDAFLKAESGLPGPRANLELMEAVVLTGSEETFLRYLALSPEEAPADTAEGYLRLCGVAGLGRLVREGKKEYLQTLRSLASDDGWRVRECVAIALQMYGESSMEGLLEEMALWVKGNSYEKRAAAAALCEPKLLKNKAHAVQVLVLLDELTTAINEIGDRKADSFLALKKGLAYCWSVAMVAAPEEGKRLFEKWMESTDKDIRWIIKENLKKNRLVKMDEAWVARCIEQL